MLFLLESSIYTGFVSLFVKEHSPHLMLQSLLGTDCSVWAHFQINVATWMNKSQSNMRWVVPLIGKCLVVELEGCTKGLQVKLYDPPFLL